MMYFLVTGLAIAGAILSVISIVTSVTFAIISARRSPPDQTSNLSPATLDEIKATLTAEGTVIPLVYGTNRLPGNVIWYGNLATETTFLIEAVTAVSGFRYFIDMWQAICLGKVTLDGVYVNSEKVEDLGVMEPIWTFLSYQFSDGETNYTPSQFFGEGPGEYINSLPGIAHVYFNAYLIGENTTTVPNINFVVTRVLETPINHQNLDSGSNPAAVIYDLLRFAGVPASKIDEDSFNTAADFWYEKDYGVNFAVTQLSDLQAIIKKITNGLDANLSPNTEGKLVLKIRDPESASTETLSDDDYLDFKAKRVTYAQIPNDFKARFRDEEQEYTTRTVVAQNQAALFINENMVTESVDLTFFTKKEVASKRITEIMKNYSYPALEIDVETHLGFSELLPGDKVTVTNTKEGIISADFWVSEISKKDLDKNEFGFKARQVTESLFDDIFEIQGGSLATTQKSVLEEFDNVRVWELPYTDEYGFEPAFLVLVNREKGFETSYKVSISQSMGSGYQDMGVFSSFAQAGFLAEEYPVTNSIDWERGILYTPALKDPIFETITNGEWFTTPRYALMGNEIVAFKTVTNEGENVRLSNVIRGKLNTPHESHSIGQQIFLFNLGGNVLQGVQFSAFYLKAIPQFQSDTFDPSDVTPISVSLTNKAKKPRKPGLVIATRSGSDVTVEIFPNTPDVPGGFGDGIPSIISTPSAPPYPYEGDLLVDYETGNETLTTATSTTFSKAGAFTLTVNSRRFNQTSDDYQVSVGASDGEYF